MATIQKRGDSYKITVSLGYNTEGKQMRKSTTFTPDPNKTAKQNSKALDVFAMEFEKRVINGLYLDGEKITFKEFSERWLNEYATTHLEKSTIAGYQYRLNKNILPFIGHMKLARIQPNHINDVLLQVYNSPKNYSDRTIQYTLRTMSTIMSLAASWNIISDNPCKRVKPPTRKGISKAIKYFELDEAMQFFQAMNAALTKGIITLQLYVALCISLFTGVRRGELIALTWKDIDYNKSLICIDKAVGMVNGKAYDKTTKTAAGARYISVPDSIVTLLKELKRQQELYKLSIGSKWQGEDYIFIQNNGKRMHPTTIYGAFKRVIAFNNSSYDIQLPNIPLHGLRHTTATLLIAENVDIKTVSAKLGHAQTSTTMNIYAHALKSKEHETCDILDGLLSNKHQINTKQPTIA